MQIENIPGEVIDVLEKAIYKVVAERIERDPDVADAYLRVSYKDRKFSVRAMYIEDHFGPEEDNDVALLDLMIDRNHCEGMEYWEPDAEAIRAHAERYAQIIYLDICQN